MTEILGAGIHGTKLPASLKDRNLTHTPQIIPPGNLDRQNPNFCYPDNVMSPKSVRNTGASSYAILI